MKIIKTLMLISFSVCCVTQSAIKLNISFDNYRIDSGFAVFDINAQILSGQSWRVGSSNIRIDWITFPSNHFSVKADIPAINPNTNIHNNSSYGTMTTTSIIGGTAISLNITWNNGGTYYTFTPGTYRLGSIRFNILDNSGCFKLTIRTNSIIQDLTTQLNYLTDWITTIDTNCYSISNVTGISSLTELPKVFKLHNNYPNPFNPKTIIRYDISKQTNVKIVIYDVLGKEVYMLVNELRNPGYYETEFDGTDFSSGLYFYKLETEYYTNTKKMVLIK